MPNNDNTYTPGPWMAEPVYRTADGSHYVFANTDDCLIAKLPVRESKEQTAANANLIAAAPEMANACRKMIEAFRTGNTETYQLAYRAAVTALAKAGVRL